MKDMNLNGLDIDFLSEVKVGVIQQMDVILQIINFYRRIVCVNVKI